MGHCEQGLFFPEQLEPLADVDALLDSAGIAPALQSGQRIVRFNTQGEREFLDDAGRAKEMEEAQKSVSEWCK